eukprot:scaffold720_cov114-Cylindrotheca_fusiformis.AAC.11
MRRLLTSRLAISPTRRLYHASGKLNADALDMVDTFARRHGEFCPPVITVPSKSSSVHVFLHRLLFHGR